MSKLESYQCDVCGKVIEDDDISKVELDFDNGIAAEAGTPISVWFDVNGKNGDSGYNVCVNCLRDLLDKHYGKRQTEKTDLIPIYRMPGYSTWTSSHE